MGIGGDSRGAKEMASVWSRDDDGFAQDSTHETERLQVWLRPFRHPHAGCQPGTFKKTEGGRYPRIYEEYDGGRGDKRRQRIERSVLPFFSETLDFDPQRKLNR